MSTGDSYSRVHRHFLTSDLPPLLADALPRLRRVATLADVGCGDGPLLWGIKQTVGLPGDVRAVDQSEDRVRRAAAIDDAITGVVADAEDLPLESDSMDAVICSQVIEHVPDDSQAVREIGRVLRPGGWAYIGSVLRGPRAWWVYRDAEGGRLLDPTHVREYRTPAAFEAVVSAAGDVEALRAHPFRFPISDLVLRAAGRASIVNGDVMARAYTHHLSSLRRLRLHPPGYSMIEAIVRKPY